MREGGRPTDRPTANLLRGGFVRRSDVPAGVTYAADAAILVRATLQSTGKVATFCLPTPLRSVCLSVGRSVGRLPLWRGVPPSLLHLPAKIDVVV